MSVDATRWAWKKKIRSAQKLVLLSLADRADEYFNCYPSISRLVNDTGLERKTVLKSIHEMEIMGILSVVREIGVVNYYQLKDVVDRNEEPRDLYRGKKSTAHKTKTEPVPKTVLDPVPKTVLDPVPKTVPVVKTELVPKTELEPVPKTGHSQCQKRDSDQCQKRDTESIIEPNKNLSVNLTIPKKQKNGVFELLSEFGIDGVLASDFVSHRKKLKAEITKTALAGFQREADKAGLSVVDAVRTSIERGWRGFCADWINKTGSVPANKSELIKQQTRAALDEFLECAL